VTARERRRQDTERLAHLIAMIMKAGPLDLMKVKVRQLKTHLSRYLQMLKETGEEVEVCVREETVARLVPLRRRVELNDLKGKAELAERLRAQNLVLVAEAEIKPGGPVVCAPAGDGRTNIATVEEIRAGRGW
jgi:antitoxin (DNA-binding transcriptional repressor) of toxin-antitoxin stability system